ncbi:MAG: VOC family protein [Anaerolineae bacterium]|uniref:VOC family protein n=1 Tax=Candidatus Flexifilum breve TaxID=3140694 RepID=UPI001ACF72E5|nr:VOC family protein [Chloroflexota bacterium]MBN8637048.1 VOC family protein [Anaerolineae bacterium]
MPPKLDLIGIIVRDMPAALNFYRQLGWDIPAAMDTEGHVEYVLPSGLRIAWDTQEVIRMFEPDWQPPTGSHRGGMAFLCANPAEVDALYARLTGMGYASHKAPWDAFWGQHYAQVEDADGNVVDLFCPLEQSS